MEIMQGKTQVVWNNVLTHKSFVFWFQSLLYEIITGMRAHASDTASSSSAPPNISNGKGTSSVCSLAGIFSIMVLIVVGLTVGLTTKSVVELLSDSVAQISLENDMVCFASPFFFFVKNYY